MYSLNQSNLQGKPVYGYGSPNKNHGIKNLNGNRVQPKYGNYASRKDKHGIYGRSKDPFKTYRNSQYHVFDTKKYYDRQSQNKKTMGAEDSQEKPSNVMSEMTFRKFKPKKGYVLVEDFKSYEDPIVHPHFIQNAQIYESMRSSIGTRQRLDGSLLRNQMKEQQKEANEETITPKIEEKEPAAQLKRNQIPLVKKNKRSFSASNIKNNIQKEETKNIPENPEYDEIKKQVVTILNDQDFEIKYDARKSSYKRPKLSKKKQITSGGLQKIARDVYEKIKQSEKLKAKEQTSPVKQDKIIPLQEDKIQIINNKEEQPKTQQVIKQKEPNTYHYTSSSVFPSTNNHPQLASTQYRRSYSPPKERINRVEKNAKELELKQKIDLEKRLECKTSYNQTFKYSKMSLDEVRSIKPAGVGTFFAN